METRYKAIEVLLAVTAGAYQTTLLTYLIQRDLFPSVMKVREVSEETRRNADIYQFIQDSESSNQALEPFILLGLLANYNKFEFQNPYQLRLNDFVNESAIQKIVNCIGQSCQTVRSRYIKIQDDLPEGWTFSATLNMLGLGAIAPGPKPVRKPVYDVETAKALFTKL